MSHGFAGNILRLDMTAKRATTEPLPDIWCTNFLGASGINDWILWNEVPPEVEPLNPENRLIFGVGPLGGTLIPLGSRTHVTTRSPLTGIFGDGNGGGFWSSTLKFAGFDHIIVQGKADKLSYVYIDDGKVSFRDAAHLKGLDMYQTNIALKKELGQDVSVAAIGPAGENLVRFANVMFDSFRSASKGGAGCVMGSKNLKAIAVRGTKPITVAHPEEVRRIAEDLRRKLDIRLSKGIASFGETGTTFLARHYNEEGCNSVRNYQDVVFDRIDDIDAEKFVREYVQHNISCATNCPVHCAHHWHIPSGRYAGEEGSKIEYIIMDAMGMHLGVGDLGAILHHQNLVNRFGMDATQTGTGIGLLMELWQHGIINEKDTGGLRMEWGNLEAIDEAVKQIGARKGAVGELLADGTVAAAEKIGKDAIKYVCHSKGLTEVEDVRGFPAWALGYAISTRGADHLKAHSQIDKQFKRDVSIQLFGVPDAGDPTTTAYKAKSSRYHEEFESIINSLGICMMHAQSLAIKSNPKERVHMAEYANIFSQVTGLPMTKESIQQSAERNVILEHCFNARLGITRKDDTLHGRWMNEPCPGGLGKGMKVADYLDALLDEYYTERGFDVKTGKPTRQRLESLGLGSVADDLSKRGII
ncbi:MAG: aldehyde ferredoxin oxidoreductase family protein [Chloroflexi bacterium]|nr:aldehyde ferredoxin oxidoreductase family protein [Chloroflexota bacterium]